MIHIKKRNKIIAILLGSILLIFGIGLLLISTSWVQSGILKQFTQTFEEATNQEISFDNIRLQWNGKLELTGIFIGDHHQDTLAFIQKIQTSFQDFNKLQQNDFNLDRLDITGVYFNIKKYTNEEVHSLKVLVDKLKRKRESRNKAILNVGQVDLSKAKFSYNDLNTGRKPILIDSLDISAEYLNFTADSLTLQLNILEGKLQSPFQKQIKTNAAVVYSPGSLHLEEWSLSFDKSRINGALSLKGEGNSFRNFKDKGQFELNLERSLFDPSLLGDSPILSADSSLISAKLEARGDFDAFEVQGIEIKHKEFDMQGDLGIQNILNPKIATWELEVLDGHLNTEYLFDELDELQRFKPYFAGDTLQLHGVINTQNETIAFELNSENAWGKIVSKGTLGQGLIDKQFDNRALELTASLQSIKFFLPSLSKSAMSMGANIQLSGDLVNKENQNFSWKVQDLNFSSPKILLNKINFEGNYKNKQLLNTLSVSNELVKLKSDLRFDFSDSVPQYIFATNISKWDINRLGLQLGAGKREFKGVVLGGFKGNKLDDIEGEFKISAAQITNNKGVVSLNPITVAQQFDQGETKLSILNTDCISGVANGVFKTSQLVNLFQQTLHQAYPFLPQKQPEKGQMLSFKLKIYKKLLDALYPEFSISENISLKGNISSDLKRSNVTLDAPLLKWNSLQLEQLHFQIDTKNPIYNTFLSVDRITQEYIKGRAFNMISTKFKDTLFFRSEFANQAKEKIPFELNFYHTMGQDGTSYFGIKKSKFSLGKETWVLNPDDTPSQKVSFNSDTKETVLSDLLAVTENQLIEVSGAYLNKNQFNVNLDVDNVDLKNILPNSAVFRQSGNLDLNIQIIRSQSENKLNISAAIDDWSINGQQLGQFELISNGNTQLNTYLLDFNLKKESDNLMSGKGVWQGLENPSLNLDLDFNYLNLDFLSPLGRDALQNIKGAITGKVNLWGPLNKLKHNGFLNLKDAQIGIPYLNLLYQADDTQVDLINQDFVFRAVNLSEQAEGTSASMGGTFSHTNFRDWSLDLQIESDRMLLLNTLQKPESLFFGQGFLNGNLSLTGPTRNLSISMQGTSEKGTSIKIPWAESYGLSDNSFVNFIDKSVKRVEDVDAEVKELKEIRGVEMDFELDVTNDALIEIVIDQETGSYLSGRGAGNLFMEINTNGKFNIWGDFITYDGIYNFKNLGVIDKKFNVKQGGTIVWEGNPLEAQMDLEAVYNVPGGANPALLLDNPNFNKSIPTEVLIRLQGNLLKPNDPVFEIDFPNTSGTVASEINYRLADPQRSQLQAISLLSQGIFINEVSVSMQGITNNLYQKASDIVSNLIGEENDKLKVGIDYLQGDKSALLDIATDDRLGFTLSTQISDRILLNGKIGVPVGGVEQTLIVGNIQIDFILNDEGSLRAKVFNKENEFRYIGDELGYTQGVGLSYNVDFNTFKDLIQKVVANQIARKTVEQSNTIKSVEDPVRFVKKK